MIKLTEIRTIFEKEKTDDLFLQYFEWVKTLIPFWRQAVTRIAERNGTAEEKRDKHLHVIDNSLELMYSWRFKKIKYVNLRRKEIDSAISFIRNGAITAKVSNYAFAPVCRNLAGILRGFLYISTFGYSDEQLPTVLAQDVYDIALCHTLFPFDTSDFVYYLPREKSIHTEDPADLDNWHLMMSDARMKFGRITKHRLNGNTMNRFGLWNSKTCRKNCITPLRELFIKCKTIIA